MGLIVTVQPTIEPLTIDEVAQHLRISAENTELAPGAPTVALISPAAAGNVDNGAHRYRVTFVTPDGETEGGAVSAAVTVADKTVNGKVTVSSIPLGGGAVTARKLYRTAAGASTYLLLATISDNSTTSYTDNIADSALGAEAPSANTAGDSNLRGMLIAARQLAENFTRRAFLTQTLRLTLDRFPSCAREIWLPRPNLLTVTSVSYVDTAGVTQTMSTDDYSVDTASLPGRIRLKYGKYWPSTRCDPDAVTIVYTAGYGPARSDVPGTIRSALKLIIGDLYENREAQGVKLELNSTVESLLWSERVPEAA